MAKIIPASTIKHVRNAPGLTASQRASLKQSPAEKKARMASAQGRMGKVVSNFAKRMRGEKTPTGVGVPRDSAEGKKRLRMASAQKRTGTLVSNFAKRQRGEKTPTGVGRLAAKRPAESGRASTGAAEAVSSLSRPIKRKATRTTTRYGGR